MSVIVLNTVADKYLPVFALGALACLGALYLLIQVPREAARKDALTFSNTAAWATEYAILAREQTHYPEDLFAVIMLPKPPGNSSRETASELALLKSYKNLRTREEIRDIFTEMSIETTYLGGYTIAEYADTKRFPATAALLKGSFRDITILVLRKKKSFDRVRPSVLNPTLDTVIPVPGHPAYPSGHSTQMHFLAYVFSELAPNRKEEFVMRADQIAKNREIAGLHYPSDSAAGVLLAQQFFDIMMQNKKFTDLLASAKREWAMHPELVQAPASL